MKTDDEILHDVRDELKWEPYLSSTEIGVSVKNSIVTLTGFVDFYWKRISAENAVKRVSEVTAVVQKIAVRLTESGKRKDTDIAKAIQNVMNWSTLVPEDKIKVKVEDGVVTLEGNVEWEFEKKAARKAVEKLEVTVTVIDNIRVTPKFTPTEIRKKIKASFVRNAPFDPDRVDVDVDGGTVRLRGKVRSLAEKKEAEKQVWLARGVTKVENEI